MSRPGAVIRAVREAMDVAIAPVVKSRVEGIVFESVNRAVHMPVIMDVFVSVATLTIGASYKAVLGEERTEAD